MMALMLELLQSIPGIRLLSVTTILAKVGTFLRF